MTLFGWDASHFDGLLSPAILARAKAEGVDFFTHKIAEGLRDTEGGNDDTALAAARDAGIEFVGGYLIPRTYASVDEQVNYWLHLVELGEPWWRDFPGWFWQIDLERWSWDNVPASVGVQAAQQLAARTGRWTILYASHGQYSDELGGWDGPLWNADYVSATAAGFAAMYPGDDWRPLHGVWRGGWAAYSGREPTFLQYTSSATIAGLSTCDANAYRGTVDDLRNLVQGGGMTDPNAYAAERYLYYLHQLWPDIDGIPDAGGAVVHSELIDAVKRIDAAVAADATRDAATLAAIQALGAGGTSVDTTAVIGAVKDAASATAAAVAQLHDQVAALQTALTAAQIEVHQLRTQVAKAAQDEAADLAVPPA